ncbi:Nn.00g107970.m01.CDS01 [Neocucurbitaria sp. VM-36]
MSQDQGHSIKKASSFERRVDRNELMAKCHLVIKRCFQKPTEMSHQKLQRWLEEYNAAGVYIKSSDAIIEEVISDTLDDFSIEKCIAELVGEIPVTNGFCGDCQHLFNDWPDLGDPEVKDPSTGLHWPGSGADWKHTVAQECHTLVLEAAARNGCRFCAFVVQVMRDAEVLDTFRKVEARLVYLDDRAMASLSLQNWGINSSQLLWVNFPGKVCDHCNSGVAQETKFESAALEPSVDTYDKQRDLFEIASAWLNECSENHEDCKNVKQESLPTRLISIAGDNVQLVLTEGWETMPRYSTLSHRWGNEEFLKLTEKNYDSFLSMIPFQELPKTFRDAVHISRRLGLDYLWIDSLCIVQGDTEDWRREASLMSSVYGGSFINIAASSAINVHEGCFLKAPYMVDGLRTSIMVNGSSLVRDFRSRTVYDMSTTRSHLATRAWAIQEKILPPRTMHFGKRGVFWECRAMTANEFLPDGFPCQLGSGLLNERARKDGFRYWWADVVRLYSAANLTFSQDKLPALSGIARRIYDARGGPYIAGMWQKEDIEAQLCWQVTTPQKRPPWRAPSWSWTSIDGLVLYRVRQSGILDNVHAHVLDAKMTLLSQIPLGEVKGGLLRIGCSGMLVARVVEGSTFKIDFEDENMSSDENYSIIQDCLEDEWMEDGGTVYLLPLLSGRTGCGWYDDKDQLIHELIVYGIVLRKKAAVAGHFYRVGMFRFWKDQTRSASKEPDLYEPFLKAFERAGTLVAETACAEVVENSEYPDQRYIIYIV